MKAAVISLGSISSEWTTKALGKYFDHVDSLDIKEIDVILSGKKGEIFYEGKPLTNYDCIYAKGSSRYAALLRSLTDLLLENTYLPLQAFTFSICHDKLLTHLKLQNAKIPMPKTYVVATAEAAKKLLKKVTYPLVMKMPAGTHGKGVMLAESESSASSMIDALALLKQPFLLQEYIETDGTDIRAFVVGKKVIAAMRRKPKKGEKRSNIHAGGTAKKVELSEETEKVAVAAAEECGCDIAAIDILESPRGPLVIEVNTSPGLQGITKASGVDVADEIAKFMFDQTKARFDKKAKQTVKELIPSGDISTKIEFRGKRILLPSYATDLTKLAEGDTVVLTLKKHQLEMKKKNGKKPSSE